MFGAGRAIARLFLFVATAILMAQGPSTTTITGIVYRADGTPAGGTLLISWPAFTTNAGQAVAAGTKSVLVGNAGALSVGLAPNAGATPANMVYTIVYQLDDGTVKTEYWSVPTSSPTTIANVRTILGSGGSAAAPVSKQYVDTALAGKADDNSVVHRSGTETISGAKQFTASPQFPAPLQASDAANKAYVDSAVTTTGSGSFVSKAGDSMSGPLQLPADPVSSNQASTKHYVDSGLTAKADVVNGVVPTGELGTGSASSNLCLHGNNTWGGCGTSSDAVSIQGVAVDPTTPTDNQVITYVASAGKYQPRPGGGVTAGMQAVKYAPDFNWTQSPAADLTAAGAKTVSLAQCPAGVTGSEPQYYVYIAATGTAEAALVTGGTCAGNGQGGTLQFTTTNAHSAGYTVGSASAGLQEALIATRFSPTNPAGTSQSGKVIVPPGEFKAFAKVAVRSSNVTVDFSGSIIECWMNDPCIYVGDSGNSNLFSDITLISPRGRPTVANGQKPFIEVNAQKTRLFNVSTRVALSNGTFSSYVQVDDDQAFLLDGLDSTLGGSGANFGVRCDATACNPVVVAPGPFAGAAAVGWLKNLNISMQCRGNGVDWQSGNTLRISDSVIQGYAQYGVRGGTRRGGFGGMVFDNVYEEVGACANPLGTIGQAGVIAQGSTVKFSGGEGPTGGIPQFANTGTTDYRYYVVAKSALGASNPLFAGKALSNGSGSITVKTADIAGATSFDLLRVTAPTAGPEQAPFGTGNLAVATNVTHSSACSSNVCTFTDTQAALQAYTVATATYFPLLDFWPGNLVLGTNQDSNSVLTGARAWMQNAISNIVAVQGTNAPAVIAENCDAVANWTPAWLSCFSAMAPGTFYEQGAMLMAVKPNGDGGTRLNLKGRLNFSTLGSAPGHIITLSDSNFQKTIATANNRPVNDANDAFIGYDQGDGNPANIGITLGAPKSVSQYIGNVGDGTNWLERLTTSSKEFKTNVQMDGALTVAGSIQASQFVSTSSGPWSLSGGFGTLSPAISGKSLMGFGPNGKLEVSENGGALVEVAKVDVTGNFSGNATTASALAQPPTQCTGSFMTGIQANGNAICSTADVMQLAETTAPTGLPNYGLFWFDASCHCPKVISNNGQAVQLGLTNLFNADANTLEEYNGTNPQGLRVYGTRTDASNYERIGFKWDNTDGYFAVASENAGTGSQRGIGFLIGSTVRWSIDTASVLKPFTDNAFNIGSSSLRPKTIYAGTSVDITGTGALTFEPCNDSSTGTSLNFLAKWNGMSPSCAVKAGTGDTDGVIGIVSGGSGTSGNAVVTYRGYAQCSFDSGTTAADYVIASTSNAADCRDAGSSRPSGVQVIGRVLSSNVAAGTYTVFVGMEPASPMATSQVPWFTQPSASGAVSFLTSSNVAKLYGVLYSNPVPMTTTQVTYNVQTVDNTSNSYDIGLYNSSGALVAHVGTTAGTAFAGSTGWKTLSWASSATIKQGKYYLAITTNCTSSCAQLIGSSTGVGFTFAGAVQQSVTTGGALPATITIPSDAYTATTVPTWSVQ
jgi:hypothetical protein